MTAANFDENSPITTWVLRCAIRPNTAASQKAVVPPLPSRTSYPSGSANSSAEALTDPSDHRSHAIPAVARAEVTVRRVGERGDRFVAHLRRTGTEASVARAQLARKLDVGRRSHRATLVV